MNTNTKDFREYMNSAPGEVIRIAATIFYTVKYNWFYILLSVLAPLVIYEMGAGREIIALLFDKQALFLNTLFLVLTLGLMSVTIWLIPSLSIHLIACYARLAARIPLSNKAIFFQYLIHLYSSNRNNPINNGQTQVQAKYLAILPWTMVCATLIQFNIRNKEMNSSIVIFLVLNIVFISLMCIIDGMLKKKSFIYWVKVIFILVVALTFFFVKYYEGHKTTPGFYFDAGLVIIYLVYLISMFVTFLLLTKGDLWYKNIGTGNANQINRCLKINNRIHALLFSVTLGALILLTCFALQVKLPAVSTLTVLLLCLNFYMLIVDSLFTAQLIMTDKLNDLILPKNNIKVLSYKMFIGVAFVGFIWLVLFNNTNDYKHTVPQYAGQKTETLESYFDNWRREKLTNMPDSTKVMNVYLISGQGGGSRAAVYILAILREIEKSRDKELYNQTFSISSISGSSAGIGQYIAQHENKKLRNYLKEDTSQKPMEQLKIAYSYNFFNSNLLGLLFYDRIPVCIKNIFSKPESNTYASFNRNHVQEKEEIRQLRNFTDSLIVDDTYDYSFFQRNMQDLYNKKEAPYYSTPLVFFNTTVLNRGRKGIFSPLADKNLFGNNMDLLEGGKPVSFHFAEIASQSFPLLNNFSSFHGDYLGDGGIYENSGISTTLQIYSLLRKYCDKNKYKVRFILINVLNAGEPAESVNQKIAERDSRSICSLLIDVFAKMPFEGYEADARVSVKQEIDVNNTFSGDSAVKDRVFNVQPTEQFALSRVFSKSTLDSFISQDKLVTSLNEYSKERKLWDSQDNLSLRKPSDTAKIYRVYTQYRAKGSKDAVKATLNNAKIKNIVLNIPPVDLVEADNYDNEIRYFHSSDSAKAVKLKDALFEVTKTDFKLIRVTNQVLSSKTPEGQLELWIRAFKQ